MDTLIVKIPFIYNDKETIKKELSLAWERVPDAKRVEYHAPEHIVIPEFDLDFWTHPEVIVYRA